jgi:hypothetical protein
MTSVAGDVFTLHVAAALVISWKGSTVGGCRTALADVLSPDNRTLKMSECGKKCTISKPSPRVSVKRE